MSKGLNLLLVTTGLCANLYGLYGVKFGMPIPSYGGHFQYLTVVGLLVATLSAIVRIINLLTSTLAPLYEALSAIATPVEGLVSVLYWPIVLYDKSLLVPEGTGFDLPVILDISLHLIPTIVCWVDLLYFNKDFKRAPTHILAIYLFAMSYYVWINICFEHNGFWPYPLLARFTDAQRGAFFIACGWGCSLLYQTIVKVHGMMHAAKAGQLKNDDKKKN